MIKLSLSCPEAYTNRAMLDTNATIRACSINQYVYSPSELLASADF